MKRVVFLIILACSLCVAGCSDKQAELMEQGRVLTDQQEYDAAFANYSELISLGPEQPDAYRKRGVVLINLGRYDEAISDFETALKLDPDLKGVYSNLGVGWYYKKEFPKAITFYDMAIATRPDNHYNYFNRAFCRAALNQNELALADVIKSLELNPHHYPAHCLKGDLLVKQGQFLQAKSAYETALIMYPERPYARKKLSELKIIALDQAKSKESRLGIQRSKAEKSDTIKPEYELQAGGFQHRVNALVLVDELRSKGYKSRVFELTRNNGQTWFLVRLGSYQNRDDAEKDLQKTQAEWGMAVIIRPYNRF